LGVTPRERGQRPDIAGDRRRRARRRWTGLAATGAIAVSGVLSYLASAAHELHDPQHGLQQLDLLYLDEPAPGLAGLDIRPRRPAVLVFCETACPLPDVDTAQVVRCTDPELAARYALVDDGRIGPGYALVDSDGQVRYRTFDPGLAEHAAEIRVLLSGLP
jgi:hypothetical protein